MADPNRFRYAPPDRRSPPLQHPARSSMPITSVGYTNSLYGGDISGVSASHHDPLALRPVGDYHLRDHAPTTTTYAVRQEPLGRSTSVREGGGGRAHRIASDEIPSRRPPIIVTTQHAAGSHASSGVRSSSPSRDPYRSSDEGQYYAQPASSISRGRGSTHPGSATIDSEEFQRLRDRTEHDRLLGPRAADASRSSRPAVIYDMSHRAGRLEFDDEGYEYTKPGELARYDLDHDRDSKPRRSRRESLDRYYRPTVSLTTDLAPRPYEQNERRQRGPPPTTWGLDKVNRTPAAGIYDGAGGRMPVPPAAPLPPDLARRPGPPSETPRSPERRAVSRTRPISLIQDPAARPSHHHHHHPDDHYQSRNGDRDRERERDPEFFQDSSITARGFGIRVDSDDVGDHRRQHEFPPREIRRERREIRKDFGDLDMRKRSYDDLDIVSKRYEDRDLGREREWERERDRDRDRGREHERDRERERERERERDRDRDRDRERDRERDRDRDREPARDRDRDRDLQRERERDRDRDRELDRERDYGREREREPRAYRDRDRDPDRDAWVEEDRIARDRKDAKGKEVVVPEDETDNKKDNLRDKMATGLGITAASLGLAAGLKDKGGDGREEKDVSPSPIKRRHDEDNGVRYKPREDPRPTKPSRKEPLLDDEDFEMIEHPEGLDQFRKGASDGPTADPRDRNGSVVDGDAVTVSRRDISSSTDDGKPVVRRRRAPSAFNPNDPADLEALKAQLAAQEKEKAEKQIPTIKEPSPERKPQALELPEPDDASAVSAASSSKEESRGRELAIPTRDEKQVRVVSPPREKEEKKPIKGILKQPKQQFPEEPNPIREGVAPHKDDKTKSDVPQGARWTKINRKMVNPEALTIGKERFEVRDDFVIVLRVLSKEEIQAYAAATATLRERRVKEYRRETKEPPREVEYEENKGDERRRQHRQHRIDQDDDRRDHERDRGDREREKHRRHRRDSDEEEEYRPRSEYHHSSRRPHRDRDRDTVYTEAN